MNPEYQKYELIDRYLRNELEGKELADFTTKMVSDSSFAELIEAQKTANTIIIEEQLVLLKERMKSDLNGNQGNGNWKKAIAFTTILIAAAGIIYFVNRSTKTEVVSSTPTTTSAISSESADTENERATPSKKSVNNPTAQHTKNFISTSEQNSGNKEETTIAPAGKDIIDNINIHSDVEVNSNTTDSDNLNQHSTKETITLPTENSEDKCKEVKISASIHTEPSCTDQPTGSIIIEESSIKGGTFPFKYSIQPTNVSSLNRFNNLSSGGYSVKIIDSKNCHAIIPVTVQEIACSKEINDVFNPTHGELWKFPVKDHGNATIKIINKSGNEVYKASLSGGYPSEWDGKNSSGQELESGLYLFIINHSDGETIRGHITIIR